MTLIDYPVPGPEQPSVQSKQSVSEKHQPRKFCLELVEKAEKAGIFNNSTLGTLSGKEYHIKLSPDSVPVQNPPRTIPGLRNHNATDDGNVDFRSFRKILRSRLGKFM